MTVSEDSQSARQSDRQMGGLPDPLIQGEGMRLEGQKEESGREDETGAHSNRRGRQTNLLRKEAMTCSFIVP
eukprot:1826893-Rhodomonas_salina.3